LPTSSLATGNVYPQCPHMTNDYNHSAKNSYRKMRHDNFPDFVPNLQSYVLDEVAKLTDFLSKGHPYFGLLINDKMKNLIQDFCLPTSKFYHASIMNGKHLCHNYFLFHFISDLSDSIDYKKTLFYLWDTFEASPTICFKNKSDLQNKYKEIDSITKIRTDKFILKSQNKINFDLFHISFFDNTIYISHRLKTALEEAKVTGIEIMPTDVL